jgi:hypothetical protein
MIAKAGCRESPSKWLFYHRQLRRRALPRPQKHTYAGLSKAKLNLRNSDVLMANRCGEMKFCAVYLRKKMVGSGTTIDSSIGDGDCPLELLIGTLMSVTAGGLAGFVYH